VLHDFKPPTHSHRQEAFNAEHHESDHDSQVVRKRPRLEKEKTPEVAVMQKDEHSNDHPQNNPASPREKSAAPGEDHSLGENADDYDEGPHFGRPEVDDLMWSQDLTEELLPTAHGNTVFQERNLKESLNKVNEAVRKEICEPLSDLEDAMMFFRKLTLLHGIPHTVADLLLQEESIQKLTLLQDSTMQKIDRWLEKKYLMLGQNVTLSSETKIRYIPVTNSLLRILAKGKLPSEDIILYWDGFREFRAKGGTLGNPPPCLLSHSPVSETRCQ